MNTFTYPSAAELRLIDQQLLPVLTMDDEIFKIFPLEESDYDLLIWEQRDNYIGLQQIRGLNGPPPAVQPIASSQFMMQPGYYGEHSDITEEDITRTRTLGTWNEPVNLDYLVRQRQDQLMTRQVTRAKQICWNLIVNGYYSVLLKNGAVGKKEEYTQRTVSPSVAWTTPATSTPIADLRNAQLKQRGYSMSLGPKARCLMNLQTWIWMISNTNDDDLHGMRANFGATLNDLADVNAVLAGQGLPQIVIHDDNYYDDTNTLQLLLPDGYVVIVGVRTNNAKIGGFRFTRNANNPGFAPGPYVRVIDRGEDHVPRTIEVHRGMNAGPVIYFPSAIVSMKVN